jgi:hypothetical protein
MPDRDHASQNDDELAPEGWGVRANWKIAGGERQIQNFIAGFYTEPEAEAAVRNHIAMELGADTIEPGAEIKALKPLSAQDIKFHGLKRAQIRQI